MTAQNEYDLVDIPQKGLFYEVLNFSESGHGGDWGFILYDNGEQIAQISGYRRIRDAGEAAQRAKRAREKAKGAQ